MTAFPFGALFAIVLLLVVVAYASALAAAIEAVVRPRGAAPESVSGLRGEALAALLVHRDRSVGVLGLAGVAAAGLAVYVGAVAVVPVVAGDVTADLSLALASLVALAVVVAWPRRLALRHPEASALALAPLGRLLVVLFLPLFVLVDGVARGLLALAGRKPLAAPVTLSAHEELRGAVDRLHGEGAVVKSDRDMVGGVLDLSTLTVADVMVHRTTMRTLDADEPAPELVRQVLDSPFTRIPLWRDEPDNIVGVLHARDVLRALQRRRGVAEGLDLSEIASDPWFVPDTTRLDDQLKAFLKRKTHLALVVDEYGEVQGLVTLEDILEEIVGEITDERDIVMQGVRPQADGSVNVSGSVPIRDLNRVMDWQLPEGEAITVAGLVIHEARVIPDAGQAFTFHGFRFQVLRRQRNRISALRITPIAKDTPRTRP